MQTPPPPPLAPCGVSNCYVFKSRLQEYAQKVNLPTPVYETIKEGPSHEPTFRSTVIVNNVRYDSLPGFFNRKAAEQSAAEVALLALSKNGEVNECISQPVHETGLCKNLLQEYAQKMNYAIPLYECHKVETRGRANFFSCTVEIGGIRYIGAAARTKKEAEIKVARTALLAIQSSGSDASKNLIGKTELTVLPCKKRGPETVSNLEDVGNHPKAKKSRFKKALKKKLSKSKFGHPKENNTDFNISGVDVPEAQVAPLDSHAAPVEGMGNFHKLSEEPNIHLNDRNYLNGDSNNFVSQTFWSDPLSYNLGDHVNPVEDIAPITDGYASAFSNEVKEVSGVVEGAPMLASDSNNIDRIADCGIMAGVNQSEDGMKAAAD